MKKKIATLTASLMIFSGVVSASSINGDYKGNPIVKVTSSGKQLESGEVPAMIYEGNTVVPISLLRQLGANVTWDSNTYSVDVGLENTNKASEYESFVKEASNELSREHVKSVSIDILPNGTYLHILYSPPLGQSPEQSATNIFAYAGLTTLMKNKIDGTIIDLVSGKGNNVDVRYKINSKDSEDYENKKIKKDEFYQKWEKVVNP